MTLVVAKVSPWLDLDSSSRSVRRRAEKVRYFIVVSDCLKGFLWKLPDVLLLLGIECNTILNLSTNTITDSCSTVCGGHRILMASNKL